MYEGLARVITFVTWRYVALRTFTLHHDAPFSVSVLPLVAAAARRSEEKETVRDDEENCSGATEKSRQRDGMRTKEEGRGGEEWREREDLLFRCDLGGIFTTTDSRVPATPL